MIDIMAAECVPGRTRRLLEFKFRARENEEEEEKSRDAEDHGTDTCALHGIPGESVHGIGACRTPDKDCQESDDTSNKRRCGRIQLMLIFKVFADERNEA